MSELPLPKAPTDTLRRDAEQSPQALHSAQFLQSDLQELLNTSNPILAELVLRELAVVNPLVDRLLHLDSLLRSLV
jgi:hypothetical protein